jgi:hypothetical protein
MRGLFVAVALVALISMVYAGLQLIAVLVLQSLTLFFKRTPSRLSRALAEVWRCRARLFRSVVRFFSALNRW